MISTEKNQMFLIRNAGLTTLRELAEAEELVNDDESEERTGRWIGIWVDEDLEYRHKERNLSHPILHFERWDISFFPQILLHL